MPKQYYELTDDKSAKFWEVEQKGSAVHLRWGKIGTNGQSKVKELDSKEDATKEIEKLIHQKTKKGYISAKASTVTKSSIVKAKTIAKPAKKIVAKTATKKKPVIINPATVSKPALLKYVKEPSRTTEELKKSIERYVEVDRAIAQREEVSPALLSKLSHSSDKNTRSKVVSNPNVLPEDFIRLGPQFPKAFLTNPVLDLILLEDPAILSQFDTKLLVQIAKNLECPKGFLRWAANHNDEQVQLAVAMNKNTPEDAIKILKGSSHKAVKESLSSKAKVSAGALPERLEEEFIEAVKGRVKSLSKKEVDTLWKGSGKTLSFAQFGLLSQKTRMSMVSNKCNSVSLYLPKVKQSVTSNKVLKESVASHILTPRYLLEELSKDDDIGIRNAAKKSLNGETKQSDPQSFKVLEIDQSERERITKQEKEFIEHPGIFGSYIPWFKRYMDKCKFYENAAKNINTPPKVLSRMAKGMPSIVHSSELTQDIKMSVAINPSTPIDSLEKLSKSKSRNIRRQLIKNPNLTPELKKYLEKDHYLDVEIYESEHPETSISRLKELSKHESENVLVGVMGNHNTPIDLTISLIEKLSDSIDANIRRRVVQNKRVSINILNKLSRDKCKYVRHGVANHLNATESVLQYLMNDKSSDSIPRSAIMSKNLTDSLRAEILDQNKHIKIVKELCLPEETLSILRNSTNEKIKQAALSNTNHPEWQRTIREDVKSNPWFIAQLKKASEEVQKAVKENNVLFFSGKDANKAVLSRRPISMILALSSGTNILPERIARVSKSTDWLVRAAVARNLGTPPNILKRLIEDAHSLVAELAKQTQDKLSGNISSTSGTTKLDAKQIAQDIAKRIRHSECPIVSPLDETWGGACSLQHLWVPELTDQLDKEWSDKEWGLFKDYLENYLPNNKDKQTELVEPFLTSEKACIAADELSKVKPGVKHALANSVYTPVSILENLAKDRGEYIRKLVAENPNTPIAARESLAKDKDASVRNSVAENPNTPIAALESLAKDKNEWVRIAVFKNPNATNQMRDILLKDENLEVIGEISKSKKIDSKTRNELFKRLLLSKRDDIRKFVAGNPDTPIELLNQFIFDKGGYTTQVLSSNPSATTELLNDFYDHLSNKKRSKTKYGGTHWHAIIGIAKNPNTSVSLLKKLLEDFPDYVAQNLCATVEILEQLAKDKRAGVRIKVARNPNTPISLIEALLQDKSATVKEAALIAISKRSKLNISFIEELQKQSYKGSSYPQLVLQAIKEPTIQANISNKELLEVLQVLRYLPLEPTNKDLTKASRSEDYLTRLAVVLHPNTTEAQLKVLANDTDKNVSSASALALNSK